MNTKPKLSNNVFILFIILFLSLMSYDTYAQGPTSPEASSFESVSAEDMVNLLTGDLSYVLPLIEVPSPEGGYPIALSYHAGISTEQEASWVGLGWTVYPGAIKRSINGYADDWKYGKKVNLVYDAGGEYNNFRIGVSVGINEMASVGLYANFSEHKAYGGETTHGFDFGAEGHLGIISGSVGTDGVGLNANIYSFGLSKLNKVLYALNDKKKEPGLSIGVNYSFKNGNISANINYSLGIASLNYDTTSGYSTSLDSSPIHFNSGSYVNNGFSVETSGFDATFSILGLNINIRKQKTHYWLFDKTQIESVGALYVGDFSTLENNAIFPYKVTQDAYEAVYKSNPNEQYGENNFSFLSFDGYNVSSEGMNGSIAPSIYQHGSLKLLRQKTNTDNALTAYTNTFYNDEFTKKINNPSDNIYFYLEGNYASYVKSTSGNWQTPSNSLNKITDLNVNNESLITAVNIDGIIEDNYNTQRKRKTNGPFIEVFTNQDIINNPTKIIEAIGFDRNGYLNAGQLQDFENGIGAYKITSADGRTYHYSLPVYQKEQFNRSTKKDESFSLRFYEEQSLTPYATHWLLTAITGPDYVDSNSNGILDKDDYGYWVEFEYGKWSDGFVWRTPIDGNFESEQSKSYGWGIKEIYYLDKVKTRTHTALFIKEDRKDNRSSIISIGQSKSNPEIYNDLVVKSYSIGSDGNFYLGGLYHNFARLLNGAIGAKTEYQYYAHITRHKTLRLKNILLLKNEDIPSQLNKLNGQETASGFKGALFIKERIKVQNYLGQLIGTNSYTAIDKSWNGEFYSKILDINDINILTPNIKEKAIKVIEFNYDETYPLAAGTPSSMAISKGRLTLKSIAFKGKKGIQTIPSYSFNYNFPTIPYNYATMDDWGYNSPDASIWSLNSVKTPTGSRINIGYESDDFYQTASDEVRIFNNGLQFTFYEFNGMLRYKIQKETNNQNLNNVNFNDYFQLGTTKTDIWLCNKHDYNSGGCHTRTAIIDIPNTSVNIVSVTSNEVVFETNLSYRTSSNNGFNFLKDNRSPFGLDYHPNMIRVDKNRGECENPPGCTNVSDRLVLNYFISSNVLTNNQKGGGLRVKNITLTDGNQNHYSKEYLYNKLGYAEAVNNPNYRSSGITSYKPSRYLQEIPYKSELPSPYVIYSNVVVKNIGANGATESKTIYKFKTLEPAISTPYSYTVGNAVKIDITEHNTYNNIMVKGINSTIKSYKYQVQNNSASLGRLISREFINSNGQIISKTINNYKPLSEIKQGISQETFKVYKGIWDTNTNSISDYKVTSSTKINYPTVLENSTTLQASIKSTTYFDKYDFNTGKLLETRTYSSDGTAFKNTTVPAYTILEYSSMGSKVNNITNKNMLIQQAANYIYLIDPITNEEKVINANITTWNNNWRYRGYDSTELDASAEVPIWRKHKNYSWDGQVDVIDGSYIGFNTTNDDGFNWGIAAQYQNVHWKNISTTTRYNHYSMPLETYDISNNHASTKMCDNNSKVLAVSNSAYTEMYYSGAEYLVPNTNYFDGEIKATGRILDANAHTGKYIVSISGNEKAFEVQIPSVTFRTSATKFKVSVWVRKGEENMAKIKVGTNSPKSFTTEETVTAGNWVQLNGYIQTSPFDATTVSIISTGGTLHLDDFRLHPISSTMTSYVYNKWDELWYLMGSNGLATKFEYDASGKLLKTYTEIIDDAGVTGGFKLISKNRYNYKKQ